MRLLAWLVLGLVITVPVNADSGAYVPVGLDALILDRPQAGLLVLNSGYRNSPLVDADAVVWLGAGQQGEEGDVLAVNVGLREPHGYGQARLGRFVLSTGAIRPVHMDGVETLVRSPSGATLELFGGMPVVPALGPRDFDWLAGGRVAQSLFDERLLAGLSYVHRRDEGQLDDEEVGADLSVLPLAWLGLHAVAAWDLVYDGLAEARLQADAHGQAASLQLFASEQVASRMLPATSLFSVVSTAPNRELGGDVSWNAFPRLDFGGTLALEELDESVGYRLALRSTLRFSDEDGGDVRVEGTRRQLVSDGWTGATVTLDLPVSPRLRTSTSIELVAADEPRRRGALWPWTRLGASYALAERWTMAGAIGAKASPEAQSELYALLRLSYSAEVRP